MPASASFVLVSFPEDPLPLYGSIVVAPKDLCRQSSTDLRTRDILFSRDSKLRRDLSGGSRVSMELELSEYRGNRG